MKYEIYKISEVSGCVFEDESDTRQTKISYQLVREAEADEFNEWLAYKAGDQDYSYSFNYKKIAILNSICELDEIRKIINNFFENEVKESENTIN